MADESETQALVCDNGSGMVKAGFAGDDGVIKINQFFLPSEFLSTTLRIPIYRWTSQNRERNDGDS